MCLVKTLQGKKEHKRKPLKGALLHFISNPCIQVDYKRDEAKQRKIYRNTSFGLGPKRIHIHIVLPTWLNKETKREKTVQQNSTLNPIPGN